MLRFLRFLMLAAFVWAGCLPNPQTPKEDLEVENDGTTIIKLKDSIAEDGFSPKGAIISKVPDDVEETFPLSVKPSDKQVKLRFNFRNRSENVQRLGKTAAGYRRELAAIRDSLCRWADVYLLDSATGEESKMVFNLSQELSHEAIVSEGKYYVTVVFWHGVQASWYPVAIKEEAFNAYDTIDCRSSPKTINLEFIEDEWMVAFVSIPNPPGNYTEGGTYRTAVSSCQELKEAFLFESGILKGWVLLDLLRETCDVLLYDNDSIVKFSFFYSIDPTVFDSTWEIDFGGFGGACAVPLLLERISFHGNCFSLNFNLGDWMRVSSWKVTIGSDTSNVGGYTGPRSGFLCWIPPGGDSYVFNSGDKYYFSGTAFAACGQECVYNDSVIIP